jgi:hypothetical protein
MGFYGRRFCVLFREFLISCINIFFKFSLVLTIGPFVVLSDLSVFAVLCSSEIRRFGSVCTASLRSRS